MTQIVQYYWPAGVNDPGHALSLTQIGNGLILPRKDTATAYLFQQSGGTFTTTLDPVTTVSGMVGGFIDSCTDGTVSGAWLLGAYGDITHMVSGGVNTAYSVSGAVSGDTFVANAYVPGRGLPYFVADNGDMLAVVSGAIAQTTGWSEAVSALSADNTKLYALLPSSNTMGVFTFTGNTTGTIAKTTTPLVEASTIAAAASPGAVAVGGWTNATLAIGATCFQANPSATFAATATPANNHITLLTGSEPNWSIASFVTGTGAPQFLVWTPNGQQLLVTDATNGAVLILNLVFGQLQFAQQINLTGAGRIAITGDGNTAVVMSPTTGNVTFLTNNVGTWSVSQTLNISAGNGVWCETDGDIIASGNGIVQWLRFLSGTWQQTVQVSGLGFSPVDLFTDPLTDIVYAAGGTGTGHLTALTETGVIASTTWSGNARDVYFEQGQICVADDTGPTIRIFSLSRLQGSFTQQATATAPAGCTFIGSTSPSVWLAGTSSILQDVFTSPFTLVPQRMGSVSFWNGTSFATTQNLLVGHQPSAMVWDAFGSLWVVTIQNDLYRFSSTGTQLLTTSLVPNAASPSGLFPSLGISSMLWWLNNLWGVSSLTEAVVQIYTTASPATNTNTIAATGNVAVTTRLLNPNASARIGAVGAVLANGTFRSGSTSLANMAANATVAVNGQAYLRASLLQTAGVATVTVGTIRFLYGGFAQPTPTGLITCNATVKSGPNSGAFITVTGTLIATVSPLIMARLNGVGTISVNATAISSPVTFNPADLANTTLSNGNLTATASGGNGTQSGVRTTGPKQGSGKYYAEFITTSIQSGERLGIANATFSLTNANGPGYDSNAISVDTGGTVRIGGNIVGTGGSWLWTAGGIVGVAADYNLQKIWFNINGRWDINSVLGITPGTGSFVGPDGATYTIDGSGNFLRNGSATTGIGGGGTGATLTFSDDFTSHDTNKWYWNAFDDGGDAYWTNDPGLTPTLFQYSGSILSQALIVTPGGYGISKPYTAGVQETHGSGNNFMQQYGYWEITVAVDRIIGLEFVCFSLSPYNWPPNFAMPVIWTDANNVQHTAQWASGYDNIYVEVTSDQGWDATQMHTYGLHWTASVIEFFRDRVLVGSFANPGNEYTNGDPIYTKTSLNTGPYWPVEIDVANNSQLPGFGHIDKFQVWNDLPFTPGSSSAASQGILYQGAVYAQAASGGAWYVWNGSAFVTTGITPPAAVTIASDPANNVGGYSFSALTGPSFLIWGAANTGVAMSKILNAGATAQSYLPSGFQAYQATGAPAGTPVVSSANVTASSLTLNWTAATGQSPITYAINWRISGQTSFTSLVTGLSVLTYAVTNLNPNVAYQFQVVSTNPSGSLTSNTYTVTTVNESPNNTTLTNTSGSITDAANNTWTLAANGTVNENGATIGFATNVTQITYWNHTVYALSSSSGWQYWTGLTWQSVSSSPVAESAQGATSVNTVQIIVDGTGAWWTLYNTVNNGYAIEINGSVDGVTHQVQLLVYWNHQVYQENNAGNWWVYGGSMGNWTQVAGDPRVGLPGQVTGLSLVSAAQTTAAVTWTGPLPNGTTLDYGKYQVQYTNVNNYTDNGPALPYCTPSKGSFVDKQGNSWTLNSAGHPVINGSYTDTPSTCLWLLLDEDGNIWQQESGDSTYWSILPTGTISTGLTANWNHNGTTGPLANVVVSGLVNNTNYSLRVYVTNSVGAGSPSSVLAFTTSGATVQINSITLSNTSITPGQPAGTTVGTVQVSMSSGSFTGSLAVAAGTSTYTTGGGGGLTPPPQASAAGYNMLTAGPAVTLNTNWWGLGGSNLRQNSDGSITDIGGVPNTWNAHVSPCIGSTGDSSGDLRGVAFGGGGYFEITFSWANPPSPGYQNVDGWPSFWSTSIMEAQNNFNGIGDLSNNQNLELDTYEAMTPSDNTEFNCGIIHWYNGSGTLYSNNDAGLSGTTHAPSGTDVTKPHKIGFLWVPATSSSQGYIKSYYDGAQVGNTYTWNQYGGGTVPNQSGDPAFSIMDIGQRRFWWGTGTKNPMTVYSFVAWQKDDSQNIRSGVPVPTNTSSTTAPVFNLSGSAIVTATSLAAGNYNLVLTATQSGATNSPYTGPAIVVNVTSPTGTGPAANSGFITADFTAPFNYPKGSGQQIVSPYMYGYESSSLSNPQFGSNFGAWAQSTITSNLAVINPAWCAVKNGNINYWNSDLTVNTGTLTNLVNNFYKTDPLGIAGFIMGVDWDNSQVVNGTATTQQFATAMANLAQYLVNYTMPNGKKFPLIGMMGRDEPDGTFDEATCISYYNAFGPAVKNVAPNVMIVGPNTSYFPQWYDFASQVGSLDCFGEDAFSHYNTNGASDTTPLSDDFTWFSNTSQISGNSLKMIGVSSCGPDWDCVGATLTSFVGAMWHCKFMVQALNNAKLPLFMGVWGGWGNTTCGLITDDGNAQTRVTPKGYFFAKGVRNLTGPRWQVPTGSGLLTVATTPASGRFALLVLNIGQGNKSGTVALSHWPVNTTGNGTVNVWQMTSAQTGPGQDGTLTTVNVSAGVTSSISMPDPSITLIYV